MQAARLHGRRPAALFAAALVVVAWTALALPAGAAAGAKWVIKGRAWGHGVGMSQYGAYGYAKKGRGYKRILGHYYRHTKVRRTSSRNVRVLVGSSSSIGFSGASKACGERLKQGKRYRFDRAGGGVALRSAAGRRLARCGRSGGASGGGSVDYLGRGTFRGKLIARATAGTLYAINKVGIEGYVKGVVPNEVPSSWPREALKAQSVAARSYALATGVDGAGFDLYDDTRSQVYDGMGSETKATNRAVRATKREVVKHRGEIAVTYFFSTSGGRTENVEYGFLGAEPKPYLKSVRDPHDDASPYHRWKVKHSRSQMEARLGDLVEGRLRRIEVLKTGRSPRIVKARVVGSAGRRTASGPTLQARLGLRSTWAKFHKR